MTETDREMWLCLCETPHGMRYWRMEVDPHASIAIDDLKREIGPVLVGPSGYMDEEEGAFHAMLAAPGGMSLADPTTWEIGEED